MDAGEEFFGFVFGTGMVIGAMMVGAGVYDHIQDTNAQQFVNDTFTKVIKQSSDMTADKEEALKSIWLSTAKGHRSDAENFVEKGWKLDMNSDLYENVQISVAGKTIAINATNVPYDTGSEISMLTRKFQSEAPKETACYASVYDQDAHRSLMKPTPCQPG